MCIYIYICICLGRCLYGCTLCIRRTANEQITKTHHHMNNMLGSGLGFLSSTATKPSLHLEHRILHLRNKVLGGSWVVISGVMIGVAIVITHIKGLIYNPTSNYP